MEKKVLAIVNGREITKQDMDFAISRFPNDRKEFFKTEEGQKQFLDQLISWELLFNYSVEEGMENSEEFKIQIEDAKRAILTQLAIQKAIGNVKVEEEEARDYYNNNKDYFKDDAKVSARHILVDSLEKAEDVYNKIKNGMEFEEAAKNFSSCPSKEQGGNLGSFPRGVMVPEFEEAAFNLEVGVLSKPVKTQFGYHIILVDDKAEGNIKPYEEVESIIKNHMLQEKQGYHYSQLVNKLKDKYIVEIK